MSKAESKIKMGEDISLAKEICDELHSENKEAILNLYNIYQPFFLGVARRRLYSSDPHNVETLLSNFWIERLNGRAICNYKGEASLRHYLLMILKRQIVDNNRKNIRQKEINRDVSEWRDEIQTVNGGPSSPEQVLIQKEKQKIIHEALLMLSEASPRDAHLVRMNLDGLNFREMAKREMSAIKYDKAELDKKTNAIKKQFVRPRTGSREKFRVCLERCMKKNKLKQEDMHISFHQQ
jgi:RNA polymerase sigma-70 factor (ECF subfamily)